MDGLSDNITLKEDTLLLGNQTGRIRISEVADVDDQAANITAWYQEYDQIRAGKFNGAIREIWLDYVQFFLESTSHSLRQTCVVWPGAFWFGLPRFDSPDAFVNSMPLNKDAIAVRPGGQDFELLTPDSYDILGVVIREDMLERHAALADKPDLMQMLRSGESFPISLERKTAFWKRLFRILAEACQMGDNTALSSAGCNVLAEELVTGLMDLFSDGTEPVKARQSHLSYRKVVSRARDYVLSHPDQVISVVDLCENLHVSRRTLQNCFQKVLGVCPTTYLKALRLNAVRRTLRNRESDAITVQDVAATWGFWHMSQFAADYRNMFSELPSETLKAGGGSERISFRYPKA